MNPGVTASPVATTTLLQVAGSDFGWEFSPDSNFVAFRGDYYVNGRNELVVTYVGPGATFSPVTANAQIVTATASTLRDIEYFWWMPNQASRLVYVGETVDTDAARLVPHASALARWA